MSRRVLIAMLAVATLAVVAFFVPAALAIRNAQQRQDLLELQREASVVATRLAADGLSEEVLQPINPDHLIGLYGPTARRLAGEGPDVANDRITQAGLTGAIAEGELGDSLVAAVPVRVLPIGPAAVRIEAPRSESQARVTRSMFGLAGAALVILAIAGGVAIWLSRRMTQPITALRDWAATSADVPDAEPPRATGMAEIDGLRDALVTGRTQIDELLRRERSFSSQVSHQLRTPVAAMRVAIETELEAPRADPRTVLEETVGQLDRLESTITSLLALARDLERTPVECDVDALVIDRAAVWTVAADRDGRSLNVSSTVGRAAIDADAIGHVIDVLVDNALRHGTGPITVAAERRGDLVVIDVADAGPAPTGTDAFAERGSDSSHGIGLRLARSLAESSRGSLTLLDAPTTTFRLTVPAPGG